MSLRILVPTALLSVACATAPALAAASPVATSSSTKCSNTGASTPDGTRWKTMSVTVVATTCSTGRSVLKRMILDGTVVGGGYGDYKVVGKSSGFTCRSRKAAVHDFEFLCTRGSRRVHGFIYEVDG